MPLIWQRRALSAVLYAWLVYLKIKLVRKVFYYGQDGAYYVDVARQVRDHQGLTSWLSMYHAGAADLPAPSTIYPVWPLLLGYLARVFPMDVLAFWLPTVFYFGTLVLGAALARRVWPRALLPGLWEVPDAGHLVILFFGYNALFFEYTSKPYTEGIAYFLFAVLAWRVWKFFQGPAVWRAAELGFWVGFSILVRSQMFILTLAGVCVCAWSLLCLRPFGRWATMVAAGVAGWWLAILPQYAWLATFTHPSLDLLLRFEHHRASDALHPVEMLRPQLGVLDVLRDRLHGFQLAYASSGKYRYEENFGVLHWAPVAMVPWLAWGALRGGIRRAREALANPANGAAVAFWVLGLGGFLSIHWLHKSYLAEWNFATRHALTVVFLCYGAVIWLAARGGLARVLAIAIVSITTLMQVRDLDHFGDSVKKTEQPRSKWHPELRAFLEEAHRKDPHLVIATEMAQRLSWLVPGVGYQWMWSGTSFEDLDRMFTELHADYLVMPKPKTEHAWLSDRARFDAAFELVETAGTFEVYRHREGAAPLAGEADAN